MMYLFGEITCGTAERVLRGIARGERELTICSEGGDFYAALAIYDAVADNGVTTIATGFVASAAVVVYLARDVRIATENTTFMTHPLCVSAEDDASQEERRRMQTLIENIYMQRTGMSATEATARLGRELVFGTRTAHELGFLG